MAEVEMLVSTSTGKCACTRTGRKVRYTVGETITEVVICEACARNIHTLAVKSPSQPVTMKFGVGDANAG